jgi:hypothetical protein
MRPEHPPEFPLAVHDLTVAYHRKPVLWDVELNVPKELWQGLWDLTELVNQLFSKLA